jgi:DNA invertase Pin-like site-specific DNA recombinase
MSSTEPKRVVLYACTVRNGNAGRILAELRAYAVAQSWEVVAELADFSGAAPESERPKFLEAKHLIETGEAQGLVTRYPAMAAYQAQEQRDLAQWLKDRDAWMRVTWRPSGVVRSA